MSFFDEQNVFWFYFYSGNQSLVLRIANIDNNRKPVEVYDGVSDWGYICASGYSWTFDAADLVCKNMGFSFARQTFLIPYNAASFNTTAFIDLDNCWGDTLIDQCTFGNWDIFYRSCAPGKLAGVECAGT